MGKKKGRQSGGFSSKAMRAAFHTEWQSLAGEVELRKRRAGMPSSNKERPPSLSLHTERPKFRLNHLQNVLQERLQHDRLEDRTRRQQRNTTTSAAKQQRINTGAIPPPPLNTYEQDDNDYREHGLVLLCIKSLASVLDDYIQAMGRDRVHSLLSLLPGKTLTALSMELSTRNLWTSKDVLYTATYHAHISRLVICLNDSNKKNFAQEDLQEALIMQSSSTSWKERRRVVPESWEEEALWQDEQEDVAVNNRRLQRLELRNMPQLSADTTLSLIGSQTTHLSLSGSLNPTSGPQVMEQLLMNDYCFQILNLSQCKWVTRQMLRQVEANVLCLQAEECCEMK